VIFELLFVALMLATAGTILAALVMFVRGRRSAMARTLMMVAGDHAHSGTVNARAHYCGCSGC